MDTADWILMVSMYVVLLPGLLAVFAAIYRFGPEVRREALNAAKEVVRND